MPIHIKSPDLTVTSVIAPSTAPERSNVNLSWTVNNLGDLAAVADWRDYIYLSNDPILDANDRLLTSVDTSSKTPLATGGSYQASGTITLPERLGAGTRYLLVAADGNSLIVVTDSLNLQPETNESDNTSFVPIHIKSPDLTVNNVIAPSTAPERSNVNLSWSVNNLGDAAAVADWRDYIYLSNDAILDANDQLLTSVDTSSKTPLAAGGSYQASGTITLPERLGAGTRYLIVAADGNSLQVETDNSNNYTAIPIAILFPI